MPCTVRLPTGKNPRLSSEPNWPLASSPLVQNEFCTITQYMLMGSKPCRDLGTEKFYYEACYGSHQALQAR